MLLETVAMYSKDGSTATVNYVRQMLYHAELGMLPVGQMTY